MTRLLNSLRPKREPRTESDSGVTLIEVLIYMVLSILIFGIIGTILINALRTEAQVRALNNSTSASQLVAESIQDGVANASGMSLVSPDGHDLDQVVRIRTASGAAAVTFSCQAWYYSNSERTIRMKISPEDSPAPIDDRSTWTLLAEGVAPGDTGKVFALDGTMLISDFTVTTPDQKPILIHNTARSLSHSLEASSCT